MSWHALEIGFGFGRIFRIAGVVALLAIVSRPVVAKEGDGAPAQPDALASAWDQASSYLFNDAGRAFRSAKDKPGINERERQFGEALVLLNSQPRRRENIERAAGMLEGLSNLQPPDTLAHLARFFEARIYEVHQDPPDLKKAADLYRKVLTARTGNAVAEFAASRLVLIEVAGIPTREERLQRLAALEPLATLLATSQGRREFHSRLGYAYLNDGGFAAGLSHLLEADKEGFTWWQAQGNAWLAIAETARLQGDMALAATYYRKFLEKYKRDVRCYTVAQRLKEIVASGEPRG